MGLKMVLVLHGMYMASLPPGVPVSSRGDCVSRCYQQGNCNSVFYDGSTKKCQLSAEMFLQGDLTNTSNNTQYLEWRRDDCDMDYTWYRSLGLCYKIYTSKKTWFQANHTCHQDGGHVIKVDSAGINALVCRIADSHSAHIWLGGFKDDPSGNWTWPDGSVISPAYWDDGESTSTTEMCMGIYKIPRNMTRRWHDFHCTKMIVTIFVCQLPLKEEPPC